ncbi:MAG TPA: glycosyltransferase [Vicinamibacterales bacterium]|nr:glycosyltransferase [Vicinamibacterales bacterium]
MKSRRRLCVVAVMEADFVTGPAKNLIGFAEVCRSGDNGLPGIDLSIVGYLRGQQSKNAFLDAVRTAGIPLDVVHERRRFDSSVSEQFRRIVEARDPDIVQTHNVKSHFFMRCSGLPSRYPWLAFHHGYTTTDLKMRCYNEVNRWSLRGARHVVTTCAAFIDRLERQGIPRDRVTVRHNSVKPADGVDSEALRAARAIVDTDDDTPILVTIGRLSREKGHVDLLRALARLRESSDNFHALIVGEGPERARIEAARKRLRLERHVTLAGLQHDVRPFYALATLVVMPSHSEGSPNVLLEAMIAGRPIVATRVGGVEEIVRHEDTALLVSPRNASAMAQALERAVADASLRSRLASRAQQVALTQYSPATYRRAIVELYQQLLVWSPTR